LPVGTIAVVLAVKNEDQLLELEQQLTLKQIPHIAVREPDWDDQLMAIGVCPDTKHNLKEHFSQLPLLR